MSPTTAAPSAAAATPPSISRRENSFTNDPPRAREALAALARPASAPSSAHRNRIPEDGQARGTFHSPASQTGTFTSTLQRKPLRPVLTAPFVARSIASSRYAIRVTSDLAGCHRLDRVDAPVRSSNPTFNTDGRPPLAIFTTTRHTSAAGVLKWLSAAGIAAGMPLAWRQ